MQLGARTDDGSNPQCPGQDSRMGISTAVGCDKSQDFVRIELQCFARCQIIRSYDDMIVGTEIDSFATTQFPFHTAGNIQDIGSPGLHISIIHTAEHSSKILCRMFDCGFGIEFFIPYLGHDVIDIIVIIEHHLMYFKHGSLFFAYFFYSLFIQRLELAD